MTVEQSHVLCDSAPMTHLPPAEAWNNPKKWLRFENGEAVGINPDAILLTLPRDDRKFIIGHEAVAMVRGLFRKDYIWTYNQGDPLAAPDIHHWYNPARDYEPSLYNGDTLPREFRNLPSNLAYIQRMFHNTIHSVALTPELPSLNDMQQQVDNYRLAHQIFSHLIESAKSAIGKRALFSMRRDTLTQRPDMSANANYDEIGEQILQGMFEKSFRGYREALMRAQEAKDAHSHIPELDVIPLKKSPSPDHVIRQLGKVSTILKPYQNYVGELLVA